MARGLVRAVAEQGGRDLIEIAIALLVEARARDGAARDKLIGAAILIAELRGDQAAPLPPAAMERKTRQPRQPRQGKAAPRAVAPAAVPAASSGKSGPGVTHGGITVRLVEGQEAIEFAGREIEITAKQARLLAILAAGAPNPIDRGFIANKWYGAKARPTFADQVVGGIARECDQAVAGIGLTVRTVHGVGIALQPREAGQ